jgi:hypothetical protein
MEKVFWCIDTYSDRFSISTHKKCDRQNQRENVLFINNYGEIIQLKRKPRDGHLEASPS